MHIIKVQPTYWPFSLRLYFWRMFTETRHLEFVFAYSTGFINVDKIDYCNMCIFFNLRLHQEHADSSILKPFHTKENYPVDVTIPVFYELYNKSPDQLKNILNEIKIPGSIIKVKHLHTEVFSKETCIQYV